MQARTEGDASRNHPELWTLDDAEAWREAELDSDVDMWMDDCPVLDDDLWMDSGIGETLTVRSLGQLGIRVS